jgi:hypothetical protein
LKSSENLIGVCAETAVVANADAAARTAIRPSRSRSTGILLFLHLGRTGRLPASAGDHHNAIPHPFEDEFGIISVSVLAKNMPP